ncbi:flagellar basal-body rod modification protein FlgD [Silicimonas algicola]|uniref:Flagellar P-ring protein n=1 Tax=Silicimonas algicola TaxID=1826607 RepID=A0A316G6P7_9RHOB|nr:flagellar basal-body rod modification protein FlgD [Silicimonas algicola]
MRLFFTMICLLVGMSASAAEVRIKDLVEFDGVRGNDLVGYGLVVGLNGTGDGLRNAPFTDFAVQLATFSGVEQQVRTNQLLENMIGGMGASGLSQLAGWVGMDARATGPAQFSGSPIELAPDADPGADAAELVVLDALGREVTREAISPSATGVEWAGTTDTGSPIEPGRYTFQIASYSQGELTSVRPVPHYARISEARMGFDGIELVLDGGVVVPSSDVTALRAPQS